MILSCMPVLFWSCVLRGLSLDGTNEAVVLLKLITV